MLSEAASLRATEKQSVKVESSRRKVKKGAFLHLVTHSECTLNIHLTDIYKCLSLQSNISFNNINLQY